MQSLQEITLKNSNGMELLVTNYGATIISLKVLDKNKKPVNVVVGLNSANDYIKKEYVKNCLYLGCTVGRYAGRISNNGFSINDESYKLYSENGVHLHGGENGFDKKYWKIEGVEHGENPFVRFSYLSEHLEEGYPGNLQIFATYQLKETNELEVIYEATTDAITHINLTNHSYFNLNGEGTILEHELHLNSNNYLDVNKLLIPSGKALKTKNTRFDFSTKSKISTEKFQGLDDTFIVNENPVKAILHSKSNGIKMEVKTNQPAIVVYTPQQFVDLTFKDNVNYTEYPAICFETQNFPDAPNNSNFPSSLLKSNEKYLNKSTFSFSID